MVQTVVVEKEVQVQGEPLIQTVVVDREVEVMGETVVQTVIVEREVVVEVEKEVIREVEKVVEAEVAVAANFETRCCGCLSSTSHSCGEDIAASSTFAAWRDDFPEHDALELRPDITGRHFDIQPRYRSHIIPTCA